MLAIYKKWGTGFISLVIVATGSGGALFFIAGSGIYNLPRVESYIHNDHGVDEVELTDAVCEVETRVPDLETTVYAGVLRPPTIPNDKHHYIINRGAVWNNGFHLYNWIMSGTQSQWTFSKRPGTDACSFVETSETP